METPPPTPTPTPADKKHEKGPQSSPYKQPNALIGLAVLVLVCIILVVLVFFILFLTLQPKKLHYSVVDASMDGYNTTNSGKLNANFSVVLRAENPNRGVSFYYDKINMTVQFRKKKNETILLSSVQVPRLYQLRRNATDLAAKLTARDVAIDPAIASNMTNQFKSGIVELEVKLDAKIRMRIAGSFKVHRDVAVTCSAVRMPAASSRKKFEKSRPCHVSIDF